MSAITTSPASIRLDAVSKSYDGQSLAVDAVTLDIQPGEFFSLLGPSGCGKTTTLRMIAGFETVDAGRILVGDRDVTDVPVHKRDMGMVFQSYALFPHRTVAENVAFGLRMRGIDKAEIAERVKAALALVALTGYEDRKPGQLSGGQQQRVALARATVIKPPVLLCDEPLGALDRKLRQQMQFELKQLQKELGVTLVFVTHDQEEALAMSDRIAVMNAGRIEQVGTPGEIYERPRTRFVADFIGEINLMEDAGGKALAVRPEKIVLGAASGAQVSGRVESANFLGGQTLYRIITADGRQMLAKETNVGERPVRAVGDEVGLSWSPADAVHLEA
ncbi:ABC transporter ATP-binding protein [Phreatobacter aquaticus]|uniref:Spermidine/putrescine import ATP-binding protein PotA n=1 Tax=Phreatobacter aquaticus TaxID=2570229 RepID=A0A4D7QIH9_9HYPH|nr:ABC transporter ATP-binding protein [Phreatobacter aquaticus]QCK85559.1 ABC transporter ATP-binding protein [Phreatobacter aquaticus]